MAEATGIALFNFEDNSLAAWTITEEGTCDMAVSASAAAHGSYGCRFTFDGTNNWCYGYRSFTAGNDIYKRVYFYIPSSFSMNASYLSIAQLMSSAAAGTYLAYMRFVFSSGVLSTQRFYYRTNSGTAYVSVSQAISRDTWHYIEYRYKSDASAGVVECYLDGTKIAEATALATSSYTAGYTQIGNSEAGVPTNGSYFDVDDDKINSSYIGAYADESSSSPVLSIMQALNQFRGGMI